MNILVGPNNCGKSTVIGAFRVLAAALTRATSRKPELVSTAKGRRLGYRIFDDLPISMENIHTDYSDVDTTVDFRFSNKNELRICFPADGGCLLLPETTGRIVRTVNDFRSCYPISIGVVPVLGPVEHEEVIVSEATVRANPYTHRASRHFRTYRYYNRATFTAFAAMIEKTWSGVTITPPERLDPLSGKVVMFAQEARRPRELFWAGFGFQIWCQLLTHIERSSNHTMLIVDEPEVYLHPEVQRQLLGILKTSGPDILMATHSTEIIGEADPSDILLVDKIKKSAQRLRDISEVQTALDKIGSLQNIELTQLARNRRVLFVESQDDFRLLRRLARRLGFDGVGAGLGLTAISSGGASSWKKIKHIAEGMEETLGSALHIGAVYDKDYRCEEEIEEIGRELQQHLSFAHFHERKEIENYLLVPAALERAVAAAVREKSKRSGRDIEMTESAADMLDAITAPLKQDIQAQYFGKRTEFFRHTGLDAATIAAETLRWFEDSWGTPDRRLALVPGKQVLRELRDELQHSYGVGLTDQKLVDALRAEEVADDLVLLIKRLDKFRAP